MFNISFIMKNVEGAPNIEICLESLTNENL